jgi:rhamnulokinase
MPACRVAAIDLGASSGRVIVATLDGGRIALEEAHRFANGPVSRQGRLYWDFEALWANVLDGLAAAAAAGPIDSVAVDTWGVDYGLLDAAGDLMGDPISYRDDRTEGMPEKVWEVLPPDRLYELTGLQHQRFNTIFQLAADQAENRLEGAAKLLMMPDLISYRLSGRAVGEVTEASTTGLVDQATRNWSDEAIAALGLPRGLFPELVEPGTVLGPLDPEVRALTGLGPNTQVIAVGSHDTASAVAGVPALEPGFAYVSSGTWSLVGVELAAPIRTEASRLANYTNELGVFGTVRYLKNVAGLWLLSESQRTWAAQGLKLTLPDLLAGAAALPAGRGLVDADGDAFLAPGGMPERIAAAVAAAGGQVPTTPFETVRVIIDSLALAYDRAIRLARDLTGQPVARLQIVGGGSLNELLCQAAADATGLPVVAGPAEGTALGNALVQAWALGAITGGLADLRRVAAGSNELKDYAPA